jgi:hypothetical protein
MFTFRFSLSVSCIWLGVASEPCCVHGAATRSLATHGCKMAPRFRRARRSVHRRGGDSGTEDHVHHSIKRTKQAVNGRDIVRRKQTLSLVPSLCSVCVL